MVMGTTTVNNDVLVKIAVQTAQEVEGVAQVGASSAGRSIARVFGGGQTTSSGIDVSPGEPGTGETSFSLVISTIFGHSIPQVVRSIREAVGSRINELTGLTVTRVDIYVEDIKDQAVQGRSSIPLMGKMFGQGEEKERGREQEQPSKQEKGVEIPMA